MKEDPIEEPSYTGGEETEIPDPNVLLSFPLADEDWKVTSHLGVRMSPLLGIYAYHTGVDISVLEPRRILPQVVAVDDGVILDNWIDHPTRGKHIVVEHDWGLSRYYHLSESFIHEYRADGSRWAVKAGTPIGRMGATGAADGAHLHFELEIGGEIVNPMLYLEQVTSEEIPVAAAKQE